MRELHPSRTLEYFQAAGEPTAPVKLEPSITDKVGYLTMKFPYRKRAFLAPASTGFTSYVFAEVESSEGGEYNCGNYMLILADCRRRIELEFFLGSARARRQSLAKADLLVEMLIAFRAALNHEAQLITEYERTGKSAHGIRGKADKTKKIK